jgi:hypothetical protein
MRQGGIGGYERSGAASAIVRYQASNRYAHLRSCVLFSMAVRTNRGLNCTRNFQPYFVLCAYSRARYAVQSRRLRGSSFTNSVTIAADDETPIHLGRLGSNPYFDAVNAVRPRHTPSVEHRCNQGRASVSSELPAASREPTRTYQLAARECLQLPAVVVCGTSAFCSRAAGSRERCGVQSVLSQVMATVGLPCSVSWGGSLVWSLHPNLSNR